MNVSVDILKRLKDLFHLPKYLLLSGRMKFQRHQNKICDKLFEAVSC